MANRLLYSSLLFISHSEMQQHAVFTTTITWWELQVQHPSPTVSHMQCTALQLLGFSHQVAANQLLHVGISIIPMIRHSKHLYRINNQSVKQMCSQAICEHTIRLQSALSLCVTRQAIWPVPGINKIPSIKRYVRVLQVAQNVATLDDCEKVLLSLGNRIVTEEEF